MLTQSKKEHWNWSDKELKFIEGRNILRNRAFDYETIHCVDKTIVEAFYIILHDVIRQVWNKNTVITH